MILFDGLLRLFHKLRVTTLVVLVDLGF